MCIEVVLDVQDCFVHASAQFPLGIARSAIQVGVESADCLRDRLRREAGPPALRDWMMLPDLDCALALSREAAADPMTGVGTGAPPGAAWRTLGIPDARGYAGLPSSDGPCLMFPPRELGGPLARTSGSMTRASFLLDS